MATAQKHSARSRTDLAEAYVEGLLGRSDWLGLYAVIRDGLDRGAFTAATVSRFLAACVTDEGVRKALRHRIVPERSWKRRVAEHAPLSAVEVERMTDVGEVVREARRLYGGDAEAAERFLTRANRRLAGEPPILVAATEGGAQAVRELLGRMEEGAPA